MYSVEGAGGGICSVCLGALPACLQACLQACPTPCTRACALYALSLHLLGMSAAQHTSEPHLRGLLITFLTACAPCRYFEPEYWSLVQHVGRSSALFGASKSNWKFTHAPMFDFDEKFVADDPPNMWF